MSTCVLDWELRSLGSPLNLYLFLNPQFLREEAKEAIKNLWENELRDNQGDDSSEPQ